MFYCGFKSFLKVVAGGWVVNGWNGWPVERNPTLISVEADCHFQAFCWASLSPCQLWARQNCYPPFSAIRLLYPVQGFPLRLKMSTCAWILPSCPPQAPQVKNRYSFEFFFVCLPCFQIAEFVPLHLSEFRSSLFFCVRFCNVSWLRKPNGGGCRPAGPSFSIRERGRGMCPPPGTEAV